MFKFSDPSWSALRFTLLAVILAGMAFPEVLLGRASFYLHDYGAVFFPQFVFFRDCFWEGTLPLWNPLSNCGIPYLAQWITMTLYPPCLVFLLLPLPSSLGWFCLMHLCLAGIGMFGLVRHWTRNGFAAAFAGISFAFGGLMLSSHTFPVYWVALAWMPSVVLSASRAIQGHAMSWRWAILAGTMQMLSGAVELVLQTWIIVFALWLPRLLKRDPDVLKRLARCAGLIIVISGLIAIQLLPFSELLRHSERHGNYAARLSVEWAMPPGGLANFFVPLFGCFRTPQGTFIPRGQSFFLSYYLGAVTLGLALWSLWKCRDRRVYILAGLALLGLALSLGDSFLVLTYLKQLVPPIAMVRYPIKFLIIPAFVIPVLAGYAIQSLAFQQHRFRICILLGLGLTTIIAAIVIAGKHFPLPNSDFATVQANGLWRVVFLAVIFLILGTMPLRATTPIQQICQVICLVMLWFDFRQHHPQLTPTIPASAMHAGVIELAPLPRIGLSRAMISQQADKILLRQNMSNPTSDYIIQRLSLWSNLHLIEKVPKVSGDSTLHIREELDVEQLAAIVPPDSPLLDFLSVSHVTQTNQLFEWQSRNTCHPWITCGQKPILLWGTNLLRKLISPDFNPRHEACLAMMNDQVRQISGQPSAHLSSSQFGFHEIQAVANSPEPTLVVIGQSYYPCWHAWVDGQSVPIFKVNHAFQALAIPGGEHKIILKYVDRTFRVGALISILTLTLCLAKEGGNHPRWSCE